MEAEAGRASRDKIFRILGNVFVSIAVLLVAVCAGTIWYCQSFAARALRAEGTVVDLAHRTSTTKVVERRPSSVTYSSSTVSHPVVWYRTAQGLEIQFTSTWGNQPPLYRKGDRVIVLYDPGSPEAAGIENFVSLWGAPLFIGVFAAIFGAVGLVFGFVGRRSTPVEDRFAQS